MWRGLAPMVALIACAPVTAGQAPVVGGPRPIWTIVATGPADVPIRAGIAEPYVILTFEKVAFDRTVSGAGLESDPQAPGAVIELPLPDGTFERFRVKESPTLAPELAKAFPEIKTYAGQGIDDPAATTRFGWTEAGFHAIILTGTRGNVFIDTWAVGTSDFYLSYRPARLFAMSSEFVFYLIDANSV
jgi:hypothetical protein